MSVGYSLHIGLNKADKNHYPGMPVLKAAVNDAVFWKGYADGLGYKSEKLHDEEATAEAVKEHIKSVSEKIKPGDIFLLTYAGHGNAIPNDKPTGFDDERNDQTWCLYNRQLLDDEIYECFESFPEGSRIVVVSDSCHSGTITKAAGLNISELLAEGMAQAASLRGGASRMLPKAVNHDVLNRFGETMYKPLQQKYRTKKQARGVKASVKLLAACQDAEQTLDGKANGIFTEALAKILSKEPQSVATAEQLIEQTREAYFFPKPNLFQYGGIIPSFDSSSPFTINIPEAATVAGYRKPEFRKQPAGRSAPTRQQLWDTLSLKVPAQLKLTVSRSLPQDVHAGNDAIIIERKSKDGTEVMLLQINNVPYEHSWSAAHALHASLDRAGIEATVEPVLTVNPAQEERLSREGDANNPDYIKEWPPSLLQGQVGVGWHLDDQHSQLAKAAGAVQQRTGAHVRIAHFDTGYIEGHPALPQHLMVDKARSFVKGENEFSAIDKSESGQDGHGLGTIALLAGNKVGKEHTFGEFEGYIGGAPGAEVVPVRLAESVVILNTAAFCNAIDWAIETGCEVITMSMAGKPSADMAEAVNLAYERGIVIVSAASNCWYKGAGAFLPKCIMYPAAFERVIAATGAMYDHQPYDVDFLQQGRFNIGTQYMQGSWGPPSRMKKALAAYTPNTPWASTVHTFLRSGGGTSSATPQVAAAAALYIAYHRKELEAKGYYDEGHQWKKVEAVRHALYTSAAKDEAFKDWKKYYGNGILRAWDALQVPVADEGLLQKSKPAQSSYLGLLEMAGAFFKNRKLFRSNAPKPSSEALATELMHLLQTDPQFYKLYSGLDLSSEEECEALMQDADFQRMVLQSPYASDYLKEALLT